MTRPTKRSTLSTLTRERLLGLAEEFGIQVRRSVVKADLLDLLVEAEVASIERVLGELNRAELKDACRAHGLDDSGKMKQAIAARILAACGSDDAALPAGEPAGSYATPTESDASADVGTSPAEDAGWTATSVDAPKRLSAATVAVERVTVDLERLLKLRVVVARFGEMDGARWWNTKGQLGRFGAAALRRGFPRTYRFAQARSVFAVAANRCKEVFGPPGCATLWELPELIEEAFDARWELWLDHASDWEEFFVSVEPALGADLVSTLRAFELVDAADAEKCARLKRSAEGRAVALPGLFSGTDADVTMLALGFARGEPGAPAVPYARKADA